MGALHGDNESRNMRLNLHCHPATPDPAIEQITVQWTMSEAGVIWLRYQVMGDVAQIQPPNNLDQLGRMDNLWRTTCFELFLRQPGQERYCEFNFSPSGNWAAYGFTSYRAGMDPLAMVQTPEIIMDVGDMHMDMEVTFGLPDLWVHNEFDAGLSAVIELRNGEKSLWALAHPAGKPDFHHRDCFMLKMEAAGR
jgi:hypothetical protein